MTGCESVYVIVNACGRWLTSLSVFITYAQDFKEFFLATSYVFLLIFSGFILTFFCSFWSSGGFFFLKCSFENYIKIVLAFYEKTFNCLLKRRSMSKLSLLSFHLEKGVESLQVTFSLKAFLFFSTNTELRKKIFENLPTNFKWIFSYRNIFGQNFLNFFSLP